MNKIALAKLAAKLTVSAVSGKVISNTIVANSDHDETDISVRVVSAVGGTYVSMKTEPYTDAAVDRTAAWIASKKQDTTK